MKLSLSTLDEKIAKLAARDETLTGDAKKGVDSRLARIRASREALNTDVEALETASSRSWDSTKDQFEIDMRSLSALIRP